MLRLAGEPVTSWNKQADKQSLKLEAKVFICYI